MQDHLQTHVVVECRGKKEDQELELEFRRLRDGSTLGNRQLPFDIVFADKKTNLAGLQLADLVARDAKADGPGSRNQFGGHAYDAIVVLEKTVPVALKKAKPGTKEFRAALRDAVENMGRTVVSHGVLNYTKDNHWGFTTETGVILKVVNGDWKVE